MKAHFKCVGLLGKSEDRNVSMTLRALATYLQQQKIGILLDESIAGIFTEPPCKVVGRESLADSCELAIVVGGDGTLLNAARSLAEHGIAVLGVNLGRLGFLVDVSPEDMTRQLELILGGDFIEEERTLLHAAVTRNDDLLSETSALNDVVDRKSVV